MDKDHESLKELAESLIACCPTEAADRFPFFDLTRDWDFMLVRDADTGGFYAFVYWHLDNRPVTFGELFQSTNYAPVAGAHVIADPQGKAGWILSTNEQDMLAELIELIHFNLDLVEARELGGGCPDDISHTFASGYYEGQRKDIVAQPECGMRPS